MKLQIVLVLSLGLIAGCGSGDGGSAAVSAGAGLAAAGQHSAPREALDRILAGEQAARGEIACDVLRSGLIPTFGDAAAVAAIRPGESYNPQAMCTASWDKPNRAAIESAFSDYNTRMAMAGVRGEAFNEPAPPAPNYVVTLTIILRDYGSAAEGIANLEQTIEEWRQGVSLGGRMTQVDYEEALYDVGDAASWGPQLNGLIVTQAGMRFDVVVTGFDAEENRSYAIRLARQLTGG